MPCDDECGDFVGRRVAGVDISGGGRGGGRRESFGGGDRGVDGCCYF